MSIIVIVDDRSINRTIYAKLSQSIGPEVEVRDFGDPAEALEWLAHNRADLIITDHDMPQIDGDEFITRFRAQPHADRVPVMMITVRDQRVLRLRALESGANDFLHSPVDHCEFVMRARNLLKLAQAMESRGQDPMRAPVRREAERPAVEAPRAPSPVARLDARRPPAQRRAKPSDWRFALRLDLNSGRVAGAQALRDGCPAELGDAEAVEAVLGSAAPLQACRRGPIRFTLRARLDDVSPAAALRLAGRLAEAGVTPGWLDLRFAAEEIVAAPDRAEDGARALAAAGVGLSVDLGALADGMGEDDAGEGNGPAALDAFVARWRPALAFACAGAPDEALRLAWRLARWRAAPVPMIAGGIAEAALLTPLRRAGVREAQGSCFGAPFAPRDLSNLFPPMADGALKRPA